MPIPRSKDSELILGYRLIERLGAGGFGEVWKAEAPGGLLKAIKFVYGEVSGPQASHEVKALERIKEVRHPFLLSLERVEIVDGQLVMVSELADKTLLDRFEECRAQGGSGIPREELLRYLLDAAEALDLITAQFRLQHLDIKPSNLFLMGGRLKVGDFGLVREICLHTGTSVGGLSPAYAAPESFTGEASLYTDQYGLAIVYQEMLTGTRPFRGRTALQLSEQHLHGRPNLAPLCEGEQAVIGRALSKNPNDRFPTCKEMVQALARIEVAAPATEPGDSPGPERGPSAEQSPSLQRVFRSFSLAGSSLDAPSAPTLEAGPPCDSDQQAGSDGSDFTTELLPDGLPAPTLFVGIGGIAGSALRQIKHRFDTRFECLAGKRPLGWLLLDTDREALREARRADLAGAMRGDETVFVPLHGPDHYRPRLKQLLGWLGRHWLFRIPRSHCTEGIRPLGRLALIDNADLVLGRLRQAIRRVASLIKDERGGQRLQILVFASISGGTGGGCLADVGYAIRRILREEQLEQTSVASMLIMATSVRKDKKELAQANAYVTLSELRNFLDPNCCVPAVDAFGMSPVQGGCSLFDEVFLTDFGDIAVNQDVEAGCQLLAEYVYLQRGTPYGRVRESLRPADKEARDPARLRSFRLARLGFPRAELRRMGAREACQRMMKRWLKGRADQLEDGKSAGSRLTSEPAAGLPEPLVVDADGFYTSTELDLDRFQELFEERVERASGSDPLQFFQRQARSLLQSRGRGKLGQALSRFFDELDERFGSESSKAEDHAPIPAFEKKLRDEFNHDRRELERTLDGWIKGIVDDPARRLKAASDELERLTEKLVQELDASPVRITAVRARRHEIRQRYAALPGEGGQTLPNLLKPLQREITPEPDELCEYGQLWIRETALRVRAEILAALLARAAQVKEELHRWHQRLETVGRLFLAKDPTFRNSERVSLGRSAEILPGEAVRPGELRVVLGDAFCSERRLASLDRRFQEEVLDAHGGLAGVMAREPRFVADVFENALFHRASSAVGYWLEGEDAVSMLHKQCGSIDGVITELLACWKSIAPGLAECPDQRLIVALPRSPLGRSLQESLARLPGAPSVAAFVTIPDDIVLCLELENLSFYSVAATMKRAQPWLADVAPKLVTRKDVAWTELTGTEHVGLPPDRWDNLQE